MAQKLHVNTAQASHDSLARTLKKAGFIIIDSTGGHDKVKTSDGQFVTLIPRHQKLAKPTARGIVERANLFGANITFT